MSVAVATRPITVTPIDAIQAKTPLAFLGLFALIACTNTWITAHIDQSLRWAIIALLLSGLMMAQGGAGRVLFGLGAAGLVGALIADWYVMANHGFVITYFAVFATLCWVTRTDFWDHGVTFARAMLMLLMGLALVQKLTSSYYLSGNLIADLLLGQEGLVSILTLFDAGAVETIRETVAVAGRLGSDHALQEAGTALAMPEIGVVLLVAIYGLTWGSLVFQGGLEVMLLYHRRAGIWLHRGIFIFSLAVYTLRPENVFLSLNLLMGYALTDEDSRSMRLPYAIAILYLLGTALIGFRPEFLR